jgi:hypothetical protein
MTVLDVKLSWTGTTSATRDAAKTAESIYTVLLSAGGIGGAFEAETAAGIPSIDDTHPSDIDLIVVSRYARAIAPTLYEVIVSYAIDDGGTEEDQEQMEFVPVTREWMRFEDGATATNSAGQSLDPPVMVTTHEAALVITRDEPGTEENVAKYFNYHNTVNSAVFRGWAIGSSRMTIQFRRLRKAGELFFRVTYRIHWHTAPPEGALYSWCERRLDEGMATYEDADADDKMSYKLITDTTGNPMTTPVMLNGAGQILAHADRATPFWFMFQVYPFVDFNDLAL